MKLDAHSAVPLYQQLQEILRQQIGRKVYTVGGKLPSENELCAQYDVTRPTIRQALDGLVREGLVYKQHGKGVFVTDPPSTIGLLTTTSTSDACAEHQLDVETRVLRLQRADTCLISERGDPAGGWVKLERLRRLSSVPTFYEHTWIQASAVPGFEKLDLTNQSLFRILRQRYGLQVRGGQQRFNAVPAPEKEAKALLLRPGTALLRIVRTMNLWRRFGTGSRAIIKDEHLPGALLCELYIAPGPFVLEQDIPPLARAVSQILTPAMRKAAAKT
jgi:DNA-binding GntR family transcriptional regulator